jgi:tetratricopeptide (TPR) repeat protein
MLFLECRKPGWLCFLFAEGGMAKKPKKTGKGLERRVAQAYREMGAWKVEHNVTLAGNQIDVYVELVTPARLLHRVAVECKDWVSPVGKGIVNDFAGVVKLLRGERLVDEGVIVSAVGFTVQAREAAKTYGIQPMDMADLEALVEEARKRGAVKPATPPISMPPAPYFAHPYPMQENFTGRVRERQMLTEWLTKDNRPILAMVAIGGMGKSALTWAWVQRDVLGLPLPGQPEDKCDAKDACRVAEGHRPEGILWWSFYEREARFGKFVDEALIYASAGELDLAKIQSAHDRVKALVSLLQQGHLLIVLDGFERELRAYASLNAAYQGDAVAEDERGDFRSCTDPHAGNFLQWITAGKSRVLITSRLFPRELESLAGSRDEELTAFDPDDAVIFFHAQGVEGTRAEIQGACAPYGYLPLALRLLSGFILTDKKLRGDIGAAARHPVLAKLKAKKHHILEVAYEALDEKKRELLSCISAFRSPVSYDTISIFNTYKSDERFDEALDELIDRGLFLFNKERNLYDMHPVVRQYAYQRLEHKTETHARLAGEFTRLVEGRFPGIMRWVLERFLRVNPPNVPIPYADPLRGVSSLADVGPVIELYHHTVRAGRYEDAAELFAHRLSDLLFYRLGAYQTRVELLRELLPEHGDLRPRIADSGWQRWILNSLANTYCLLGQPGRAIDLFAAHNEIARAASDDINLAVGLFNLGALAQMGLGRFEAASSNLLEGLQLCRRAGDRYWEAFGRVELAHLLICEGIFDGAAGEMDSAMACFVQLGQSHGVCFIVALKTLLLLRMGTRRDALRSARETLQLWRKNADEDYPVERTCIYAKLLLALCLLRVSRQKGRPRAGDLGEAEENLREALARCRKINLVELEPDILLAWGRWHRAKANPREARENAEEALKIAGRCEYRLKQADCHNLLARLAIDEGNKEEARKEAEIAYERAWCDGPPHCYKPALDEAEKMLRELGAEPPKME